MSISTDGLGLLVPHYKSVFKNLAPGHDRFSFPGPVVRVTGGQGGEAILIVGNDKTALIDCGMAYAGPITVGNLQKVLGHFERELDYILLSHSHYDHIGALPFIRKAYPGAEVMGSSHCARVLEREGARNLMKDLGETARDLYDPGSTIEIPTEDLYADRVLDDHSNLCIGTEEGRNVNIVALETPGHTNCSMSFLIEPAGLLFASESTGIPEGDDYIHTPSLKSFMGSLDSVEKCRSTGARHICIPHYGVLPESYVDRYWDMFVREVASKTRFVLDMRARGISEDAMLEQYIERYWDPAKEAEQPKVAFDLNAGYILQTLLKELDQLAEHFGM